jgi:NAD(P)-dependent dehydrogenase (short-subunit alcohol dehydrogenase family)
MPSSPHSELIAPSKTPLKCVVVGAGGGIGHAIAARLMMRGDDVMRLGRREPVFLDLEQEDTIESAASMAGDDLDLVIDATGFLHNDVFGPEKSLRHITPAHMHHSFAINAIGPALLMKHFLPRLATDRRSVFASLSARLGSITDNRAGGWFSYRASKAALNQLVRTGAIELARTNRHAICVALHPGTVDTSLSASFAKAGLDVQQPQDAAAAIMNVTDGLTTSQTGQFLDHHGAEILF